MDDYVVVITGGFDPLHSGHLSYINAAKEIGRVIIGLNSDAWLQKKKGAAFMPFSERSEILKNLKNVMAVVEIDDSDGTACDAIRQAKEMFPSRTIVFANGGDRTEKNIPEMEVFKDDPRVIFKFGVGGSDKKNSSSWILKEWKEPKTERPWGYYRVLHDVQGCKVKELTIEPGQKLSMQKHKNRNEWWIVSEGRAVLNTKMNSGYVLPPETLEKHSQVNIQIGEWHQLCNPFEEPCRIVEVQYGETCDENDIERG